MTSNEVDVRDLVEERDGPPGASPPGPAPIALVARLLSTLERAKIAYCHWKNNDDLERSARGEDDLDLLVRRRDGSRFLKIMHHLGLKQATPSPDKRLPGVLDFYGYDVPAARFVHVHVHFQLNVRPDATMNYCLPLEREYLASTRRDGGFRVPEPEIDFIALVIRLVLKHATWDAHLLLQGELSRSERREFQYLRDRMDMQEVRRRLLTHLPFVAPDLFESCLGVVEGRRSLLSELRTGQRLRRALRPFSRRGPLAALGTKIVRRGLLGIRRGTLRRDRRKARLSQGGLMIAFIGGDGAGKTSVVDAISSWLSAVFDVRRIHLGRPPPSASTRLVAAARTGTRMILDALGGKGRASERSPDTDLVLTPRGALRRKARLSRVLWDVSVARDRYRAFARARRFCMNGGLVVSDRFPLPGVLGLMDAPQLRASDGPGPRNWLIRRLSELERNWYRAMVPPELIIVLRLHPDTAVERKKNEHPAYVRMRSEEVWKADFGKASGVVVDASIPLEELLSELKELIWSRI